MEDYYLDNSSSSDLNWNSTDYFDTFGEIANTIITELESQKLFNFTTSVDDVLSTTISPANELTTSSLVNELSTVNLTNGLTTASLLNGLNSTVSMANENTTISLVNELNTTIKSFARERSGFPVQLRDELWVIPLLVLSSINLFVIIIFEIYVLYKSRGNRQHQFLGQTLLFGLFLCSLLGYAFVLTPHWVLCAIIRAGVGLAYAIVFATLVVKCLFLLNLHNENYIDSSYQCLILFFAIGIQVTIFTQWLVYRPPETILEFPREVCKVTPLETVEYLSYIMLLLIMAIILSIRTRSLTENNKEAIYIGVTVGILVIWWVTWISIFLIFDRRYEDPAQGFGLIGTAIIVFLVVFVPKAVQIAAACRKNGSNHGSHSMIYSPSFLHLQPHAVLPSCTTDGTLIKQNQSNSPDYWRGFPSGFWRYDYPTFYQMEPRHSDRSSQRKSNISYIQTLY